MPGTTTQRNDIFVFDAGLTDLPTLIDTVAPGQRVIVLDSGQDGLTQLAAALAGESGLDAIHILSHGSAGSLLLGNAVIDSSTLDSHAAQLARIGARLSGSGDILLYGCDVASGSAGMDFLSRMAERTGADVAASTDLTGSALLGGNWALERRIGAIEAMALAPLAYSGVFIAESEVNDTRGAANSLALASTITANLSTAADVDYFSVIAAAEGVLSLTFNPPASAGAGYFALRLEDAQGTTLASFLNAADSATFQLGLAQAGTYHVKVGLSQYRGYYSYPSSYSLAANFAAGTTAGFETESNNTRATADAATLGGVVVGDLSARSDVDYYAIAVTSASVLGLTFTRPADPYGRYYHISLEDGDGTRLASFTDATGPFNMLAAVGQAGTYFVRVEKTDPNGVMEEGKYSLAFAQAAATAAGYETEPNSVRANADHADLGVAMVGQLSSFTDVDWYAIDVSATGLLTLAFNRPNALYDGYFTIRLEDAAGLTLAGFVDSSDPRSLTVALSSPGTYYARISNTAGDSFRFYDALYSVQASHLASSIAGYETESNDTRGTANLGVLQTALHGQLSSRTDTDYFAFTVASAGVLALDFVRPADRFGTIPGDAYVTLTVESSTGKSLGAFFTNYAPQVLNVFVPTSGTYYVKLTSDGGYPNSYNDNPYTLTATHTPSKPGSQQGEPNDTFQTATPLTGGVQVLDQFHSLADIDYFSFTTAGAGTIVVAFDRPDAGPLTFFNLRIENSAGALLAGGTITTDVQTFQVAIGEADTYYVRLNNITNQGGSYNDGNYGLTASLNPDTGSGVEHEPNDTPALASAMTLDTPVFGKIGSATDKDYFSFSVAAAGLASLSFNRPPGTSDAFEIGLEDAAGHTLAAFADVYDPQTWTVALAQAGTYYARITNHAPYSQLRDQYSVVVGFSAGSTAGYELESNGTRGQSTPLTLGSPITGQIASPTDLDYYVLTAETAGMLNLSITPGGSAYYDTPTVRVEDSVGNTLASFNNDYVKSTNFSMALAEPGTYHVRISNTAVNGGIPIAQTPYALLAGVTAGVTTGVETESNNTAATADQVAVGGSAMAGQLFGMADVDYYRFTADQAGLFTVSFVMPSTGTGFFDVGVVNDAGVSLASRHSLIGANLVKLLLPEPGVYYVRIGNHDTTSFRDGQYSFTTSLDTATLTGYELEGNNTAATANALALGSAVVGQIGSSADVDCYAVTVGSSGTITLNFDAGGYGGDSGWFVTLSDPAGTKHGAFYSNGYAATAMFGLANPGTYLAAVSAGSGAYGHDRPYTLSAAFQPGTAGLNEIRGTAGGAQLYGGDGADKLFGGVGFDVLSGGPGNDTLDGGANLDIMRGGSGDDTFVVDHQSDVVTEAPSEGFDTVRTVLNSWVLSQNVEALVYTGTVAFFGGGNGDNNTLTGATGNDTLSGGGGADLMVGGQGNDTYVVENAGDVVIEGVGAGNDTVLSAVSLQLFENTENLSFKDRYGDLVGTGNALDNTITGNDFNNHLSGAGGNDSILGGTGRDSLFGNDGNDTLAGDYAADLLDGGAGDDSLQGAQGDDTLLGGGGQDLLQGGEGNDSLAGGDGRDTLEGGAGNDTLASGPGRDLLDGGDGDDTYWINSREFDLQDSGGVDSLVVAASFVKLPGFIENVSFVNGAQALPYWIDALLPAESAGDHYLDLLGGTRTIGYAFPGTLPAYDTEGLNGYGFSAFDSIQKAFARQALTYVSSVIGVNYVEVGDAAALNTIAFANNAQYDSAAYAYYPSDTFLGNDVFLDNLTDGNLAPADGTYAALTLIHELGHSLGLEHPFFGDSDAPYLGGTEDDTRWTVMSYTDHPEQYHLAYSPLDIAALQYLYGPSATARAGNDTYSLSTSSANFIWDGAGTDTLNAAALAMPVTLYLEPGYWGHIGGKAATITAAGQVTVNFGSIIENLLGGSADDKLIGNAAANVITGNAGSDSIDGAAGNDTLRGGEQADTLLGGAGDDYINGGKGADIAGGGDGNDSLVGAMDNDTLSGDNGFDLLDGGEGNDSLAGGLNADTLWGGAGDDFLSGGKGTDNLNGGDGNDTLVGGLGTDQLTGGAGADHFVFKHPLDGSYNIDTFADFTSGMDVIELSTSIFAAFSGQLGSQSGVSAHLTYRSDTGALAYDADGAGSIPAVIFAIVGTIAHPAAMGNDFLVVA